MGVEIAEVVGSGSGGGEKRRSVAIGFQLKRH